MLSHEDNELLCRVGPGTGMGDFMRRFWMPVMLAEELGPPDGEPVRVRLLGEDLLAFRDTEGRIGVVDEYCPHRRASLFFGRNEACGLRCVYHGWKFDVDGNCVDMPSEPPSSSFKDKIKLTSYPAREHGGVIWAYMGPAERMGEVPHFEWMDLPANHRYASRWVQDSNYAQAVEGEIDSAHVSFLHSRIDGHDGNKAALTGMFFSEDTAPHWRVVDTDFGMTLGARRRVEGGRYYWRMNQWYFPFYTMIAPIPGTGSYTARMWVPMDDEHVNIICVTYTPERPCTAQELEDWRNGVASHALVAPGTDRPVANRTNNYLIDREAQRTKTFTGIAGVRAQDAAMTESPGPISDRTKEHLGSSDTAVIRMRKLLLEGAKALARGEEPEAARGGDLYHVRSHSVVIDAEGEFDQQPEILAAMGM